MASRYWGEESGHIIRILMMRCFGTCWANAGPFNWELLWGSMEVSGGGKWPHNKDLHDAVFWDRFFGCRLGHLGFMLGLSWTMQ